MEKGSSLEAARDPGVRSDFRIASIARKGALGMLLRLIGPAADRLLGLRRLRLLYERKGFAGLEKRAFLAHFMRVFRLRYDLPEGQLERIPAKGGAVILANHPLGGLEGILMGELVGRVRPDLKMIGNLMLYYVKELSEYFILVNNMVGGLGNNLGALTAARRWLADGHCILVFPAGRVGLYRADRGYVTDEPWDRIGLSLGLTGRAAFVPVFIGASCSNLFSALCRFIYPMKLLLLVREFMKSFSKEVKFRIGLPIQPSLLEGKGRVAANAYLRMRVYLLDDPRGRLEAFDPVALADEREALAAAAASAGKVLGRAGGVELQKGDGELSLRDESSGLVIGGCGLPEGADWLRGNFHLQRDFTAGIEGGLGMRDPWLMAGQAEAEELLWRWIAEIRGARPLYGILNLVPPAGSGEAAYSASALALMISALTRGGGASRKRLARYPGGLPGRPVAVRPIALSLHPEVDDYMFPRGMPAPELESTLASLEGHPVPLPPFLRLLDTAGACFPAVGLDGGGVPIALFRLGCPQSTNTKRTPT